MMAENMTYQSNRAKVKKDTANTQEFNQAQLHPTTKANLNMALGIAKTN